MTFSVTHCIVHFVQLLVSDQVGSSSQSCLTNT